MLHRIFNKAIEYGVIDKNPVTKTSWIRPHRTAEEVRAWWTQEEESKAMAVLVTSWRSQSRLKYLTLATQIAVGLRFSELRVLEKRDLDLQAPRLWIRRSVSRTKVSTPKNRRARFHVIPCDLADELRRFMLTTDGQLLFADPRGVDKRLTNKVLNLWDAKLADEAGVRRITSHGARHTAGASYAVMGAGQKVIASLPGHADIAATERYTHVSGGATGALVEVRWCKLRGSSDRLTADR